MTEQTRPADTPPVTTATEPRTDVLRRRLLSQLPSDYRPMLDEYADTLLAEAAQGAAPRAECPGHDTAGGDTIYHKDAADCSLLDAPRAEGLDEIAQLRRIAAAAGRVSDAAVRSADIKAYAGTGLMMALGELDAELGKPLRRLSRPSDDPEETDGR